MGRCEGTLRSCRLAIIGIAAAAVALVSAGPLAACHSTPPTEWVVGVEDWFIAANWNHGVPTPTNDALINNWGEANIDAPGATARDLKLGYTVDGGGTVTLWAGSLSVKRNEYNGLAGSGTVLQRGGEHYVSSGALTHGDDPGSFGTYDLADGLLSVLRTEYVGREGSGAFIQAGGLHEVTCGGLVLAYKAGSSGAYSLDAGTLDVNAAVIVGDGGSGAFTMASGTFTIGGGLTLADDLGSDGAFSLSGDSLFDSLVVDDSEIVGDLGFGSFEQNGGLHLVGGSLKLANNIAAIGTYSLLDGTLGIAGSEYIGYRGVGIFSQVGGTHTVGGTLFVGGASGSSGKLAIDAGSLVAKVIRIGDSGELGMLDIYSDAPYIEATQRLTFGALAIVTAAPGAAIHVTGACVSNYSAEESNLAGLENVALLLDGGLDTFTTVEVAGADLGADAAGFVNNFTLGSLVVGDDATPTKVRLKDAFDNGNRGLAAEALYVHDIVVGPGSTLDLRYVKVYYDGTLDNQGTILGSAPIAVP